MRIAEGIQLFFGSLLAVASWVRPLERARRLRVTMLALVLVVVISLVRSSDRWLNHRDSMMLRDWIPAALLLIPYWQIGQFFTGANPSAEAKLRAFDQSVFQKLGIRPSERNLGVVAATYLQLAYLLVYPMMPFGVGVLYLAGLRQRVDYYWIVVLVSVYICFAITPFVQAMPPRLIKGWDGFRVPPTRVGMLNRVTLDQAGIQAITFPSGHVASSVAAALVLLRLVPPAGAVFLAMAISIAVATVVCGYHYAADVLLAVAVTVLVFIVTWWI